MNTPTISEIDELEILFRMADDLFLKSCNIRFCRKTKHIEYIKQAEFLDLNPIISDYYRNLCKKISK